jgi:hypothetical protein
VLMSSVSFPDEPPFDLPLTQTASASNVGDVVEVVLRAVVPGHGSELFGLQKITIPAHAPEAHCA